MWALIKMDWYKLSPLNTVNTLYIYFSAFDQFKFMLEYKAFIATVKLGPTIQYGVTNITRDLYQNCYMSTNMKQKLKTRRTAFLFIKEFRRFFLLSH
jgi:hypothetical protein